MLDHLLMSLPKLNLFLILPCFPFLTIDVSHIYSTYLDHLLFIYFGHFTQLFIFCLTINLTKLYLIQFYHSMSRFRSEHQQVQCFCLQTKYPPQNSGLRKLNQITSIQQFQRLEQPLYFDRPNLHKETHKKKSLRRSKPQIIQKQTQMNQKLVGHFRPGQCNPSDPYYEQFCVQNKNCKQEQFEASGKVRIRFQDVTQVKEKNRSLRIQLYPQLLPLPQMNQRSQSAQHSKFKFHGMIRFQQSYCQNQQFIQFHYKNHPIYQNSQIQSQFSPFSQKLTFQSRKSKDNCQYDYSGMKESQNRLYLKEIESVIDDFENPGDDISEVIGRGWENREQDFSPRIQNAKTETIGTAASHIKNSEIGNSAFVINQSLMRWA